MKLKSFRFRIALLSALLSALAVAGFSGVTYLLFYQSKLTNIDHDLTDNLLREASMPRPQTHWQAYEQNRISFFGEANRNAIALLVLDQNSQVIYQSSNWQAEFNALSLFPAKPQSISNSISLENYSQQETSNQDLTWQDIHTSSIKYLKGSLESNPKSLHQRLKVAVSPKISNSQKRQQFLNIIEAQFPNQSPFLDHAPPDGQPPPPDGTSPESMPFPQRRAPSNLSNLVTRKTTMGQWRIGAVSNPFVKIAMAINLQVIDQEMRAIQGVFLIAVPFTLVLVMVGAWWLSADALKPIRQIINTIRRINVKELNQRAPVADTDLEFIELVQVFNQMMERLERSFLQASRFSADAAHELKTPLAILQGELELALHQTETGSRMQQTLSNLLDEVSRLGSITRKLLLLSLADAGRMNLQKTSINLSIILHELAEDLDILAPEISLELAIEPDLEVMGDRELIIQILHNLINNAIKYNLPNGWLKIIAKIIDNFVYITIVNSSQNVSPEEREHIFDRFYRADRSRNRTVEGFGLGLSLAREIARAHHGNLQIDPPSPNSTSFTLTLPL